MPLEIIGAGFGRTATHSLRLALEKLGYKTHHMVTLMPDETQDPGVWVRAYDDPNHEDEWEKVYGDYQAAIDYPTCTFYKELSERYPEAKVILTVRSPESWFKSIHNTIFKDYEERNKHLTGHRKAVVDMVKHTAMGGILETEPEKLHDEAYMCKHFTDHIEEVKRTIPKERLLIMNLGDGWDILCPFLGKPIPDEPYPVSNSTKDFHKLIASIFENENKKDEKDND
ncbi:P-loop containing nucleoside triphosphate hydrolase protein [Cunninghamella echinulata]|nr:P-loop containing nucleoside triphosphate hydrolase protein [Cunninghamella echinulata]